MANKRKNSTSSNNNKAATNANADKKKRGCTDWCVAVCAIVGLLLGFAMQYNSFTLKRDSELTKPLGHMVTLENGASYHIYCSSPAKPTKATPVVLVHGMSGSSHDFTTIQQELSKDTTVCAVDRLIYSSFGNPIPTSRGCAIMAEELHAILAKSNVTGPYVFVGHSHGGAVVQYYALTYPSDVAGLVLVDSAHREMLEHIPKEEANKIGYISTVFSVFGYLSKFGLFRFFEYVGAAFPPVQFLSDDLKPKAYALYSEPTFWHNSAIEAAGLNQCFAELTNISKFSNKKYPNDLPVTAITATKRPGNDAFTEALYKLHAGWKADTSKFRHVNVSCDHFVQVEEPSIVVAETRRLLK